MSITRGAQVRHTNAKMRNRKPENTRAIEARRLLIPADYHKLLGNKKTISWLVMARRGEGPVGK
jgi:hypothetical protein